MKYRCPKCKSETALWEGVELSGWRVFPNQTYYGSMDRDVYWESARTDGFCGCGECGWEGIESELVKFGGEPASADDLHGTVSPRSDPVESVARSLRSVVSEDEVASLRDAHEHVQQHEGPDGPAPRYL